MEFLNDFVDESKFYLPELGGAGLPGDLGDGESFAGGASVAGGLSRAQQLFAARVVSNLIRAFYKAPFALPNAVAGLADVKQLCEDGAFESIDDFTNEVHGVLQRWASGQQTVAADDNVRAAVMADAHRAIEMFDHFMLEEPSRMGSRSGRESTERLSEPPDANRKRKVGSFHRQKV